MSPFLMTVRTLRMGSAHRNTHTCRLSASPYWLYKGVNFVCVLEEQLSTWRQERRTALLCHRHCIRPRNTPLVYIRGSQTFFKSNFGVSPIDFLYTDKTPEIGKTDWERTWVLYCIVLYCFVFLFRFHKIQYMSVNTFGCRTSHVITTIPNLYMIKSLFTIEWMR